VSSRRHFRLIARLLLLALLASPAVPALAQVLARSAGVALATDVCTRARATEDGTPVPVQHGGAHCLLCCGHAGGAVAAGTTWALTFDFSAERVRLVSSSEYGNDERGMRPEARAPPAAHRPSV
jgi:hypothetical protein